MIDVFLADGMDVERPSSAKSSEAVIDLADDDPGGAELPSPGGDQQAPHAGSAEALDPVGGEVTIVQGGSPAACPGIDNASIMQGPAWGWLTGISCQGQGRQQFACTFHAGRTLWDTCLASAELAMHEPPGQCHARSTSIALASAHPVLTEACASSFRTCRGGADAIDDGFCNVLCRSTAPQLRGGHCSGVRDLPHGAVCRAGCWAGEPPRSACPFGAGRYDTQATFCFICMVSSHLPERCLTDTMKRW